MDDTLTSGLLRLGKIFEARKPKNPAVIAEIDGTVELLRERRRGRAANIEYVSRGDRIFEREELPGKSSIVIRSESGIEREHFFTTGRRLLVHSGMFVRAGEILVAGPVDPRDIVRICGVESVQRYLVREIQNVYRSHGVTLDDKHIEIVVVQMLRHVRVESRGDTTLLPGSIMDGFEFRAVNEKLAKCLKISHKGDSDFAEGAIVPVEGLNQTNAQIEALGGDPAKGVKPKSATASTQLLGINEAAVLSSGFISASGFQEAINVLTEAALAGKVYRLVRPAADAIQASLVLDGAGFRSSLEAINE